jgi:hypothetical protein
MATLKMAMFFAGRRFVLTMFNPLALSDRPVFKGYEHIRCFEKEPVSLENAAYQKQRMCGGIWQATMCLGQYGFSSPKSRGCSKIPPSK